MTLEQIKQRNRAFVKMLENGASLEQAMHTFKFSSRQYALVICRQEGYYHRDANIDMVSMRREHVPDATPCGVRQSELPGCVCSGQGCYLADHCKANKEWRLYHVKTS